MSDVYNELSKIGKQLMISEPFYGVFLSTLHKSIDDEVPTAGVCKQNINYQLIVNPEFWNSLNNDKKKIGLLKHELLHICFHHLTDRDNFPDHELHNIAADVEINQYLTSDYYPTPDILLPSTFPTLNLPLKAGTKEYYRLLQQAKNDGSSPSLKALLDGNPSSGGKHGSVANGLHPTWADFDSLSDADKKLVKAQIDHQIKSIIESQSKESKDRGFVPNELKDYIDSLFEIKPPSYDWRGYFRRFMGTASKIYTKKTRRKLNKRFQPNPALKIKPKKNILVGIDTSGSVGKKDLEEFFSEIHHMYKTGTSITIAEGDATIHKIYEYKGKPPEHITGRGGTDMNPFITYFNENRQYNSLIILTDGHIGNREVKSFKPMLTVLCSHGEKIEAVKENGWGNVIKIQD
jgi:predicted metal-dependent peptidase